MLALLPFLAPPPHPPRPLCNAIPRVRMYNGSTARESQRRAIYPLLFAFAGRQRAEKTSTTTFVLHEDQERGTQSTKLLSIYNCHYDRVRCPSFTHDRQFAFRIRNVHRDGEPPFIERSLRVYSHGIFYPRDIVNLLICCKTFCIFKPFSILQTF